MDEKTNKPLFSFQFCTKYSISFISYECQNGVEFIVMEPGPCYDMLPQIYFFEKIQDFILLDRIYVVLNQQWGFVMNSVYLVSGRNVHLTQSGIFGKYTSKIFV